MFEHFRLFSFGRVEGEKKAGERKNGVGETGAQIANRRFVIRLIGGIREIITSVISEQLITVPDLCKMGRRPQTSTTPAFRYRSVSFRPVRCFRANRKEGSLLLRMSFPHFLSTNSGHVQIACIAYIFYISAQTALSLATTYVLVSPI